MKQAGERDPRTVSPFRPGAGTVPPALVGRDDDLKAMENAIAQVVGGEPPQVALFVGEPGMGKTALLRQCERMAREAGGIVLRCEMARKASLQAGNIALFEREANVAWFKLDIGEVPVDDLQGVPSLIGRSSTASIASVTC